jgi:hypothetical protein
MLILFLLFVEEDIFRPVLPRPEIKPDLEWFKNMEENWMHMAFNNDASYNFVAFKFCDLEFESLNKRDFADHYSLRASLKSLSYNLQSNYTKWDGIRFSETKGWKWILDEGTFLLTWFDAFSFKDSLTADVGLRFYQLVSPFFIGGWLDYKESLDYGLIVQIVGLRGELGKETGCIGWVSEHGEFKVGKFRDRFPIFFYPVEGFSPKVRDFYGTKINMFNFKITGGKKYFYTEESSGKLEWIEEGVYFANIEFEKERFGFQYFYQNKGIFTKFGEIHANSSLGFLGSEFSLTGYLTPRKYLTGGFSLWLRTKFSPFFSLKNLSWAPAEENFQDPVYYLGIRYADKL